MSSAEIIEGCSSAAAHCQPNFKPAGVCAHVPDVAAVGRVVGAAAAVVISHPRRICAAAVMRSIAGGRKPERVPLVCGAVLVKTVGHPLLQM